MVTQKIERYKSMLDKVRNQWKNDPNKFEKQPVMRSPVDLLKTYDATLRKYIQIQQMVLDMEEQRDGSVAGINSIAYFDTFRHTIHKELQILARRLKKDQGTVELDILLGSDSPNLENFDLKEFRVGDLKSFIAKEKSVTVQIGDSPVVTKQSLDSEELNFLVIPFEQEDAWRLFDHSVYFQVPPTGLERRRRMEGLANALSAKVVQIELPETFHRKIRIFGVIFPKEKLFEAVKILDEKRETLSIDPKYFDKKQIESDWRQILNTALVDIDTHELGEYETKQYLIKRLRRSLTDLEFSTIDPEFISIADEILSDALEKEDQRETEQKIDSHLKLDEEYRDFERFPKNGRMGKGF